MKEFDAEMKKLGFGKKETIHVGNNPFEQYRYRFTEKVLPSNEVLGEISEKINAAAKEMMIRRSRNVLAALAAYDNGVFLHLSLFPPSAKELKEHVSRS
ncbi:MAG: hypothetical protein V1881_03800 [Candidatus Micrarchaeota archaeon]